MQDEAEGIVAMLLGEVIHLVGNFGEIQELNASEFSHGRCNMTFQFIAKEETFIPKSIAVNAQVLSQLNANYHSSSVSRKMI